MTLEEFTNYLHQKADKFYEKWEKGHDLHPINYPDSMEYGDWMEQYLSFNEVEEDEQV